MLTDHPTAPDVRRRRPAVAAALVGALVVLGFLPAVPASAATTISISGTVTDTASKPLKGLRVSAGPANGGQFHEATTAADGTFTVSGVVPGETELSVDDPYDGDDLWRMQSWNGTAGTEGWTTFQAGTTNLTGLSFRLRPSSGIVGTAVDESGKPLANIAWDVLELDEATGLWRGRQYGPLLTDENGRMWFAADPGTQWRLCFEDSWYQPVDEGNGTWTPAVRHQAGCWNAAGKGGVKVEGATTITVGAVGDRVPATITMKTVGKALTPGEPSVVGATDTGSTLTAYPGTWGPSGVSVAYQWVTYTEDGARKVLAGATGRTLTTTSAMVGRFVTLEVTGTRAGYAPMVRRAGIGRIGATAPTTSQPLAISGTPAPGQTLSATNGSVTPSDSNVGYTWFVDGVRTLWGPTFDVTAAHRATTIEVRAYYYAPGGGERLAQASVRVPGLTFVAATPKVTGTLVVGKTLTATVGTWTPAAAAYSYQWYRNGTAITGATAKTYVLTAGDRGKTIKVKVTGTRAGYDTASRTSAATAAVKGVLQATTPTISGTAAVGRTLSATVGTWKPSGVTFTYRWYRDGTAISGATKKTYALKAADKGKRVQVRVTGTKAGYVTLTRASASTPRVV